MDPKSYQRKSPRTSAGNSYQPRSTAGHRTGAMSHPGDAAWDIQNKATDGGRAKQKPRVSKPEAEAPAAPRCQLDKSGGRWEEDWLASSPATTPEGLSKTSAKQLINGEKEKGGEESNEKKKGKMVNVPSWKSTTLERVKLAEGLTPSTPGAILPATKACSNIDHFATNKTDKKKKKSKDDKGKEELKKGESMKYGMKNGTKKRGEIAKRKEELKGEVEKKGKAQIMMEDPNKSQDKMGDFNEPDEDGEVTGGRGFWWLKEDSPPLKKSFAEAARGAILRMKSRSLGPKTTSGRNEQNNWSSSVQMPVNSSAHSGKKSLRKVRYDLTGKQIQPISIHNRFKGLMVEEDLMPHADLQALSPVLKHPQVSKRVSRREKKAGHLPLPNFLLNLPSICIPPRKLITKERKNHLEEVKKEEVKNMSQEPIVLTKMGTNRAGDVKVMKEEEEMNVLKVEKVRGDLNQPSEKFHKKKPEDPQILLKMADELRNSGAKNHRFLIRKSPKSLNILIQTCSFSAGSLQGLLSNSSQNCMLLDRTEIRRHIKVTKRRGNGKREKSQSTIVGYRTSDLLQIIQISKSRSNQSTVHGGKLNAARQVVVQLGKKATQVPPKASHPAIREPLFFTRRQNASIHSPTRNGETPKSATLESTRIRGKPNQESFFFSFVLKPVITNPSKKAMDKEMSSNEKVFKNFPDSTGRSSSNTSDEKFSKIMEDKGDEESRTQESSHLVIRTTDPSEKVHQDLDTIFCEPIESGKEGNAKIEEPITNGSCDEDSMTRKFYGPSVSNSKFAKSGYVTDDNCSLEVTSRFNPGEQGKSEESGTCGEEDEDLDLIPNETLKSGENSCEKMNDMDTCDEKSLTTKLQNSSSGYCVSNLKSVETEIKCSGSRYKAVQTNIPKTECTVQSNGGEQTLTAMKGVKAMILEAHFKNSVKFCRGTREEMCEEGGNSVADDADVQVERSSKHTISEPDGQKSVVMPADPWKNENELEHSNDTECNNSNNVDTVKNMKINDSNKAEKEAIDDDHSKYSCQKVSKLPKKAMEKGSSQTQGINLDKYEDGKVAREEPGTLMDLIGAQGCSEELPMDETVECVDKAGIDGIGTDGASYSYYWYGKLCYGLGGGDQDDEVTDVQRNKIKLERQLMEAHPVDLELDPTSMEEVWKFVIENLNDVTPRDLMRPAFWDGFYEAHPQRGFRSPSQMASFFNKSAIGELWKRREIERYDMGRLFKKLFIPLPIRNAKSLEQSRKVKIQLSPSSFVEKWQLLEMDEQVDESEDQEVERARRGRDDSMILSPRAPARSPARSPPGNGPMSPPPALLRTPGPRAPTPRRRPASSPLGTPPARLPPAAIFALRTPGPRPGDPQWHRRPSPRGPLARSRRPSPPLRPSPPPRIRALGEKFTPQDDEHMYNHVYVECQKAAQTRWALVEPKKPRFWTAYAGGNQTLGRNLKDHFIGPMIRGLERFQMDSLKKLRLFKHLKINVDAAMKIRLEGALNAQIHLNAQGEVCGWLFNADLDEAAEQEVMHRGNPFMV